MSAGASTLNLAPGRTAANLAIVKVGAGGKIALYNYSGSTHLTVDIVDGSPSRNEDQLATFQNLKSTANGGWFRGDIRATLRQ